MDTSPSARRISLRSSTGYERQNDLPRDRYCRHRTHRTGRRALGRSFPPARFHGWRALSVERSNFVAGRPLCGEGSRGESAWCGAARAGSPVVGVYHGSSVARHRGGPRFKWAAHATSFRPGRRARGRAWLGGGFAQFDAHAPCRGRKRGSSGGAVRNSPSSPVRNRHYGRMIRALLYVRRRQSSTQ